MAYTLGSWTGATMAHLLLGWPFSLVMVALGLLSGRPVVVLLGALVSAAVAAGLLALGLLQTGMSNWEYVTARFLASSIAGFGGLALRRLWRWVARSRPPNGSPDVR